MFCQGWKFMNYIFTHCNWCTVCNMHIVASGYFSKYYYCCKNRILPSKKLIPIVLFIGLFSLYHIKCFCFVFFPTLFVSLTLSSMSIGVDLSDQSDIRLISMTYGRSMAFKTVIKRHHYQWSNIYSDKGVCLKRGNPLNKAKENRPFASPIRTKIWKYGRCMVGLNKRKTCLSIGCFWYITRLAAWWAFLRYCLLWRNSDAALFYLHIPNGGQKQWAELLPPASATRSR